MIVSWNFNHIVHDDKIPHHSQAMHRRVLNQSVQIQPKPSRDFGKVMYGQALNP